MSHSRVDFFNELATIMEENPSEIQGDKAFRNFNSWDSIAVISYVALLDEKYHILIDVQKLSEANTFDDLAELAGI